jgi:RNA polymerase sigma-70 factor, ECF subfamily
VSENEKALRFQNEVAPHMDAGYNLARWLTGNDADAEDVLQEASLKAYRFLDDLRSAEARAWFLRIVRNTSYSCLKKRTPTESWDKRADEPDPKEGAEAGLLRAATAAELRLGLESLPAEFREALVLRELEDLSYQEIGTVAQIPEGTVMSRLSRARALLRKRLSHLKGKG